MYVKRISQQDFEIIRDEVLGTPTRFDHLVKVAENLFKPYVVRHTSSVKHDPCFAKDTMMDIQHKLITTIVTHFFMRSDEETEKNAENLTRWMYCVAHNTVMTALIRRYVM